MVLMLVGKTSLLDAFNFMSSMVLNPIGDGNSNTNKLNYKYQFKYTKFLFDSNSKNAPIDFEVYILMNNNIYQYGYSVDENIISSEWLYLKGERGYTKVFERDNGKISSNKSFKELNKYSDSNISDNVLFLSLVANIENNVHTTNVYNWFNNFVYLNLGNHIFEYLLEFTVNEALSSIISKKENSTQNLSDATTNLKNEYLAFLKAIDTGIDDIYIKNNISDTGEIDTELYTIHKTADNKSKMLPFEYESQGTKKMFSLYALFSKILKNGGVLFLDELDSKLHPLLVKYILAMFHNPDINTGNAQLIYSTHDVTNLNKDVFRRDEIWFVEKDKDNISNLFSLSDYIDDNTNTKIRNDATYNKDYLTGRYGAIPVLKELNDFF